MKKLTINLITLSVLLLISNSSFSQDIILLSNGTELSAKVIEINPVQVKYKLFSNPEGPTYVVNKSSVVRITYPDSSVDAFNEVVVINKTEKPEVAYNPNIIRFHFFDVVYSDFTVSYERIFNDGKIGLQIPLGLGFNTNYETSNFNLNNLIYSGLGINIYPAGNKVFQYMTGGVVRIGNGRTFNGPQNTGVDLFYWRFLLNNGFILNLTPAVNMSAVAGIGIVHYSKDTREYDQGFNRTAFFSVCVGYRF